jgi:hypothetical protein
VFILLDYVGITQQGASATNYQILPGDRLFIEADSTVTLNNRFSKTTAPLERALGVISLIKSTLKNSDGASSDLGTPKQSQKPNPNLEKIETDIWEAMYRYLQEMIPQLDSQ